MKPKKSRGGYREGSGRPYGTGKYKEETRPIRVPISLLATVNSLLKLYLKALQYDDLIAEKENK